MRVYDIIDRKKRGECLTFEELAFLCREVAEQRATDSQIAAFCMATLLRGMTDEECACLTVCMRDSGAILRRPRIDGVLADKHSTGGVSDSTTLILVPILSALGVRCAKLSGRGLAHTGGTLDKLESFPNIRVDLTAEEFETQVRHIGAAIAGQTQSTVPVDKRMYAVRDVTATVDSIPLIASSVMSKKLASFADLILLDVKYGSGAFMKTAEEARELARLMVYIGNFAHRRTAAAITRMEYPLGDHIGCNLEVRECIQILKGKQNDLAELSLFHCAKILQYARGVSEEEGLRAAQECVVSGKALDQLAAIVRAQGGDARAVYDETLLPLAEGRQKIVAELAGYVYPNALELGKACAELGGGRNVEGESIDHTVGLILRKRAGEFVERGETLAEIYYNGIQPSPEVGRAFIIKERYEPLPPLVHEIIQAEV